MNTCKFEQRQNYYPAIFNARTLMVDYRYFKYR